MIRNLKELGPQLQNIMTRLMANQNLLKLLYYTDKDPLSHEDLTQQQVKEEIYEKLIKIVPRIGPKETAQSIVAIEVIRGSQMSDNQEFREITLNIEVFTPLTQWFIKDKNMRPFCILGEIQNSLCGKIIDGLGRVDGGNFAMNFLTDEISCYKMTIDIIDYV